MSSQELAVKADDFIAICRALKAAGAGQGKHKVKLHFKHDRLDIEGEMGGGSVQTTGDVDAIAWVSSGTLAQVASLHRQVSATQPWIKCVLDAELGEIRFPRGGLKAKFHA